MQIVTAPKGGLPPKSTIAFAPEVFDKDLKIGTTIYFKINSYEKWSESGFTTCFWPEYTGKVQPCSNKK
ncbi:MAG: hypothetical protein Q4G63_12850 [Bacteroidia bacterium]|nr:hypothetical protein [Bacteroidia bacterium]